ncbi:MAG: Nif3-like dinuclear metal center hexameric protein [Cellulosilyticaceae bacterium]
MYTVKDIVQTLEQMAPSGLAEGWDNVGLLVGSRKTPVNKVLCALDLNEAVLEEAIRQEAQCIVTHHPFIFSALKRLDLDTPKGHIIAQLIKRDIAVYSMHTNLDIVTNGINDVLCEKLGITETQILHKTYTEALSKLCIYVPKSHAEAVRACLITHNNYAIGNYTGCTFTSEGQGTFVPLVGAKPYIGEQGRLEEVEEVKLECLVRAKDVRQLLGHISKVHPYEEIAYDVFELQNIGQPEGLGRYGNIEPMTVAQFAQKIKERLGGISVRVVGNLEQQIKTAAVCSGSGSSFIGDAAQVADIYITGDVKFHEAQQALDKGLCVIDIGHYASENIIMPILAQRLMVKHPDLEAIPSTVDAEVFQTI